MWSLCHQTNIIWYLWSFLTILLVVELYRLGLDCWCRSFISNFTLYSLFVILGSKKKKTSIPALWDFRTHWTHLRAKNKKNISTFDGMRKKNRWLIKPQFEKKIHRQFGSIFLTQGSGGGVGRSNPTHQLLRNQIQPRNPTRNHQKIHETQRKPSKIYISKKPNIMSNHPIS